MGKTTQSLKESLKFETVPAAEPLPDLNLLHLQLEMTHIDTLLAVAVERWQQAGRDPNDAFRGLVVTDEEASQLLALPFASHWGDLPQEPKPAHEIAAKRTGDVLARQIRELEQQAAAQGITLRLHHLAQSFGLDELEVRALLLALAPALDLRYEQLYSYLQNDINRKRPMVSLLLNLLCGPGTARLAGLGRFGQDAQLFHFGLLEAVVEPGMTQPSVLSQGLAVDRTVVAWLLGEYQPHAELSPYVRLHQQGASAEDRVLALPMADTLEYVAQAHDPILLFHGPDATAQKAAAKYLANTLDAPVLSVDMGGLMASGLSIAPAFRTLLRDARLLRGVVSLEEWDACLHNQEAPVYLLTEIYNHPGPVIIAGRQGWQPRGMERARTVMPVDFELPDYAQRKVLWQFYLEQSGLARHELDPAALDSVEMAGQFTLSSGQIRDAVASGVDHALRNRAQLAQADLYVGARMHSGVRLADLARKITPRYGWDDIILPNDQVEILRELVATVRGRSKVLEEWGLGRKLASSAAVTVLFAGPPGTGKTMSAEVIAKDLGLDLYKIDLSNMVSKYIGETEKNLEHVFTEAQSSNAILFFDEADAIFGKRAGVKDARDRYANIEVSYLLQRMEYYDGVTILATNLRSNIDEAFLRRLQFAVDIPFPDEKDRLRIWETLFPQDIPRVPDLPLDEMAKRFKLAGGNIRNIILGAAYLAAAQDEAINTQHLLHATRREFQKMGRLVPEDQL
ncbi:MAG: AAA family ATPase [Litorilinea sp.]